MEHSSPNVPQFLSLHVAMLSCLCGMVKPVILMTVKGRSYWAAYRFVPGDIWVQIRGLGTLLCGIGWWCIVLLVRDRHI